MKKLKVLFLCTGNSCRSQMAEGWTRHLKSDVIDVYSAGTSPKAVDPLAIEAMREVGIDISGQRSKKITDLPEIAFDYAITVCGNAKDNCPFFSGSIKKMHVGFDDPPALAKNAASHEEAMCHYRLVRDEIRDFVATLPDALNDK